MTFTDEKKRLLQLGSRVMLTDVGALHTPVSERTLRLSFKGNFVMVYFSRHVSGTVSPTFDSRSRFCLSKRRQLNECKIKNKVVY